MAAIGVIGVVTFFGGAILWARYDELGLPANDAVAAVPSQVLVTTGASFLVPALLLALAAVVALYLFHLGVEGLHRFAARNELRRLEIRQEAAKLAERKLELAMQSAEKAKEAAEAAQLSAELISEARGAAAETPHGAQAPEERVGRESMTEASVVVEERRAEAEQTAAECHQAQIALEDARAAQSASGRQRIVGYVLLGLLLIALELFGPRLLGIDFIVFDLPIVPVIWLIGIVLITSLLAVIVHIKRESFAWFGLAAFASLATVIAAATYFRTIEAPKAEPAAVLREERSPLIGFFVAESSDAVYIGRAYSSGQKARLVSIPRTQLSAMSVGSLAPKSDVEVIGANLALRLCDEETMSQARSTGATTDLTASDRREAEAPSCTRRHLRRLEELAQAR